MRWKWILALVLLTAGLGGAALYLRRATAPEAPLHPTQLFDQVFTHVLRFGVDSIGESELYRRAADGLLSELEDEYATLLPGDSELGLTERADLAGLGMLLATRDGRVSVLSVLPGSPADSAGLLAGDQVLEAGGRPLDADRRDQVLSALDGAPGTTLEMRARRPGVGLLGFHMVRRAPSDVQVTHGERLDPKVGYVGVRLLGNGAAGMVRREVESLVRDGATTLILDLRGASQGSLEEAVRLADMFLEPGAKVLAVLGRDPEPRRYGDDSPQDPVVASLPVVVLVDSSTADAAEVVAGALQDNDRALLMGEATFGRGLSPETFQLAGHMNVRISTGRWFTPSGRSIQRDTSASDTLAKRLQVTTARGRHVYSGGGIVPDTLVLRDSLPPGVRAFNRAIGSDWSTFVAVVRSAGAAIAAQASGSEEPVVPAAARSALRDSLDHHGISIPQDIWAGAATLVEAILADAAVRAAVGDAGLLRRRLRRDALVSRAAALLRTATTPTSLVLEK